MTLPSDVWRVDWEQFGRQFVAALHAARPPYIRHTESRGLVRQSFLSHIVRWPDERVEAQPERDGELLFAGFVVLAIVVEIETEVTKGRPSVGDLGSLASLRNLVLRRGEGDGQEAIWHADALALMRKEDRQLAEAWASGRTSFVGTSEPEPTESDLAG